MAWTYILIASVMEIIWSIGIKQLHQPGKTWTWGPPTIIAMVLTYVLLFLAVKSLEIGTAYAVWTGIGAAGTAILGILLLGESVSAIKIASIFLIVAGIVGLALVPEKSPLSPGS